MKKKLVIAAVAAILVALPCFAEEAPMNGWKFTDIAVILNGRKFWSFEYAESWREQDGYALVLGNKLHYWLYDTITYHDGDASEIYNNVVPRWVEKMGYVIDFDNIAVYNPNVNLANSVKALMKQRGCDMSVTLVTRDSGYPTKTDYIVINEYLNSKNVYKTTIYYLYK